MSSQYFTLMENIMCSPMNAECAGGVLVVCQIFGGCLPPVVKSNVYGIYDEEVVSLIAHLLLLLIEFQLWKMASILKSSKVMYGLKPPQRVRISIPHPC